MLLNEWIFHEAGIMDEPELLFDATVQNIMKLSPL